MRLWQSKADKDAAPTIIVYENHVVAAQMRLRRTLRSSFIALLGLIIVAAVAIIAYHLLPHSIQAYVPKSIRVSLGSDS